MDTIHNHVKGIDRPLRRNPFYNCASCIPNKISKRGIGKKHNRGRRNKNMTDNHNIYVDNDNKIEGEPGKHFHMDFGFVRGSKYRIK